MAVVSLSTIKNWFKTGLKPTQQQFWDTWDSFFHKEDGIEKTNINGLEEALGDKADANHAHAEYADVDAENIDPETWLQKLNLSLPGDEDVSLSQNYAELEVTTDDHQSDFNSAVNAQLEQLKSDVNLKLPIPGTPGEYHIYVDSEGWAYVSADRSENFNFLVSAENIKSNTVEFTANALIDEAKQTFLYVRGLYISKDCYTIADSKVSIDQEQVDYTINDGDLINFIYQRKINIEDE